MAKTYLEKHVEELTNRVALLEEIVSKLLGDKSIASKYKINNPYPTPKRYEYEAPTDTGVRDELFDEAWKVVSEAGVASTSYLQRKLSLGYNRSSKIMDQLEIEGVISPSDGVSPRKILKQYPKQSST